MLRQFCYGSTVLKQYHAEALPYLGHAVLTPHTSRFPALSLHESFSVYGRSPCSKPFADCQSDSKQLQTIPRYFHGAVHTCDLQSLTIYRASRSTLHHGLHCLMVFTASCCALLYRSHSLAIYRASRSTLPLSPHSPTAVRTLFSPNGSEWFRPACVYIVQCL